MRRCLDHLLPSCLFHPQVPHTRRGTGTPSPRLQLAAAGVAWRNIIVHTVTGTTSVPTLFLVQCTLSLPSLLHVASPGRPACPLNLSPSPPKCTQSACNLTVDTLPLSSLYRKPSVAFSTRPLFAAAAPAAAWSIDVRCSGKCLQLQAILALLHIHGANVRLHLISGEQRTRSLPARNLDWRQQTRMLSVSLARAL